MSGTIAWGEAVVEAVIERGCSSDWKHHVTQPRQGHLIILHTPNPNGGIKLMKLNVWCTTGTVGSYLIRRLLLVAPPTPLVNGPHPIGPWTF